MNKLLWLVLLWVFITLSSHATTPISSNDLFRNPETFSMKLNPEGSFIMSYGQGKNDNFFELIDPKSQQSFLLLSLPFHDDFRLVEYQWVDNQTVYIALKDRVGFLHLDLSGETPTGKYTAITAKGYLVSALPEQNDKVLFANNIGKSKTEYVLVNVTTKQLEQNTLEDSEILDLTLDGALHYFYDEVNDVFLAFTVKGDKFTYWLLKSHTSEWEAFWAIDKTIDFTPVGLLSENTLAVLTNQDQDLVTLREFDIKTQKLGKVLFKHAMYDLTDADLEPMGGGVKSVNYIDHGIPTTHYFANDEKQQKRNLAYTFDNQQLAVVSTNLDSSKKIVLVLNSDNPGKYYLFDNIANKAQIIKEKSPHLEPYELAKSTTLTIKVENNVNVEAMLTKPASEGNGVLLVYPHGGPIGVRDYATYDPKVQYLTSRGYSVLTVNFRGSVGFGKQFLDSGKAQFGQLIEQDISTVVNAVKKQHNFTNTCSIGSSYGGYSAVMLAIKHPDEYQCVVAMYGVYDLPLLFSASNYEAREVNRKRVIEIVGELDDSLKKVSPFYIAQQLHAPILLIAGDKDEIAYIEHTNRMKYRLKQFDKDFEVIVYKNVAHGHYYWSGDRHQFAYIDDFIKRKLNLSEITKEGSKAALANDAIVIADGYNFDKLLPQDLPKAFDFYRKAAALGESRALFNIGSFYHQGRVVEKDMEQAITWYEKSSTAGYASASYRLGYLYQKGEHVVKDVNIAYKKFILAAEQKKNYALAEIQLTRSICLGEGTTTNVESCFARLFYTDQHDKYIDGLDEDVYDAWQETLSHVVLRNSFTVADKAKLNAYVKLKLELNVFDIYAAEEWVGFHLKPSQRKSPGSYAEEATIIPLDKSIRFGVTLSFDTENILERKYNKRSMIMYKWILPESIKYENELASQIVGLNKDVFINLTLSEDYEHVEGEWTLQVYNLDEKLLYEKTFETVAKASK